MRTVSHCLVDTLAAHGISRVFCVPGESYLGLLDALHGRGDVDTVVCRHESGAGFMALADARLTERPGVALVSRGPGASNASIAVHTAQQDGVPFVLIVGQVPASCVRRDAFQEIDYGRMFGGIAKWVAEVTDPERIAETMLRALRVATSGVPGPVVIAIPEDILTAPCAAAAVAPQPPVRAAPAQADMAALGDWLRDAERPLVIAGSGLERTGGREALRAFAERWQVPVMVSFRRHDLFPNAHPLYAGDLGLANPERQLSVLREADLLLVLGARLSDITTQGYTFPRLVRPEMRVVHVHADPAVIGTHFSADLGIGCDPVTLMHALAPFPAPASDVRETWAGRLREERVRISAPRHFEVDDGVPFERVVAAVGEHLAPDGIVTLDAGTFGAPAYRVIAFAPPQRMLAPIAGAMGFGVPAAVAASLRDPHRQVVCLVGDGGFLMTGSELAVAIERRLPLKVIVSENRMYGSIRIHQERDYPGRVNGTTFANPDLAAIGAAYGFAVTRIRTIDDLDRIPAALAAEGPQFVLVESSVAAVLPRRPAEPVERSQ